MSIILHECKRLRARITLAQCETNRTRPKERSLFCSAPVRPHACNECKDWMEWTKENDMTETDRIIDRMMEVAKVPTQRELGEILGGNVYSAKSRGIIPDEWIEYLTERFDADEQYLRTGLPSGHAVPELVAEPDPEAPEESAEPETEKEFPDTPKYPENSLTEEWRKKEESEMSICFLRDFPTEHLIEALLNRMPRMMITIKGDAA